MKDGSGCMPSSPTTFTNATWMIFNCQTNPQYLPLSVSDRSLELENLQEKKMFTVKQTERPRLPQWWKALALICFHFHLPIFILWYLVIWIPFVIFCGLVLVCLTYIVSLLVPVHKNPHGLISMIKGVVNHKLQKMLCVLRISFDEFQTKNFGY